MSGLVFSRLGGHKIMKMRTQKLKGAPQADDKAMINRKLREILEPSDEDTYEKRQKARILKNRKTFKNRFNTSNI